MAINDTNSMYGLMGPRPNATGGPNLGGLSTNLGNLGTNLTTLGSNLNTNLSGLGTSISNFGNSLPQGGGMPGLFSGAGGQFPGVPDFSGLHDRFSSMFGQNYMQHPFMQNFLANHPQLQQRLSQVHQQYGQSGFGTL